MRNDDCIGILRKIREDCCSLKYPDAKKQSEAIITRIQLFVKNEMSDNEEFWSQKISNIKWGSVRVGWTTDEFKEKSWNEDKERTINLIDIMIESLKQYNHSPSDTNKEVQKPIIFVSHSSKDIKYIDPLVEILEHFATDDQIVYTSNVKHKIPLTNNVFEYLKKRISADTVVIMIFSDNYMQSPACMNEMGAAWVVGSLMVNVICPGFDPGNPNYTRCATDPQAIYMKIEDEKECKSRLFDLIEIIEKRGFAKEKVSAEKKSNLIEGYIAAISDLQNE